ncbi:winged helix-turn-helix transcriptional regulator [Nonomuraea sp. NPDC050786]|uniref:winged helix-turn-helix transcriptional regulator n=1 Tax=Nonomuraea sp. NPDC050786 TaxID=3154840 RepID=UPI0033F47451
MPTDILSTHLKQLEEAGLATRRALAHPERAIVYELTDHGRDLESALTELGRWGARTMTEPCPGEPCPGEPCPGEPCPGEPCPANPAPANPAPANPAPVSPALVSPARRGRHRRIGGHGLPRHLPPGGGPGCHRRL